MIVSKDSLLLAFRNVAQWGDTDVLPFPLENHWFHDAEDEVVSVLTELDGAFDTWLSGYPLSFGRDFRQVLIYAPLNFQSRRYDIDSVCLVNPRLGIYLQEDLNNLCLELAGAPAIEVFAEIIDVSQPHWMDEAV